MISSTSPLRQSRGAYEEAAPTGRCARPGVIATLGWSADFGLASAGSPTKTPLRVQFRGFILLHLSINRVVVTVSCWDILYGFVLDCELCGQERYMAMRRLRPALPTTTGRPPYLFALIAVIVIVDLIIAAAIFRMRLP